MSMCFLLNWKAFRRKKGKRVEVKNRLNDLPTDLQMSILSSLTMKEAAKMSLVSHHWNYLWLCFPNLNFEDKRAMRDILFDKELLTPKRSRFLEWVNRVLDQHLSPVVNDLSFTFDLDSNYQSHVDKWVDFALQKRVQTFVLDLDPVLWHLRETPNCTLPPTFFGINPSLTSLCLKYVDANAEEIGCILHSFPLLENLTIEGSAHLTNLRVSGSSLNLKYLEVSHCDELRSLEIYAPKLSSFVHYGRPLKLCVQNAHLLSMVSIGGYHFDDHIAYAFDSFSDYFPQLEYLLLRISLRLNLNLEIDNNKISTLKRLKHLVLNVDGKSDQSLLGWIPVIEACPVLEKLSLKKLCSSIVPIAIDERRGRPLKCLKILELAGFQGFKMELEFADYVFKNAPVLQEVIVDCHMLGTGHIVQEDVERIVRLEERLPPDVKLTTK